MNFDRVAHVYDQTRGLPDEVGERIAASIAAAVNATPATRFLEPGIGTGRIALPLAEQGYQVTGLDISEKMMERLREKAESLDLQVTLVEGDVTALPFPDDSFDVVLFVHVLHLIPDWVRALEEARRVTVPGGYLILGGNDAPPEQAGEKIRDQWHEYIVEQGGSVPRRHSSIGQVLDQLTAWGCRLAVYRPAWWENELRPGDLLERMRQRTFSQSWEIPDEMLARAHERMLAWALEEYGDLERPIIQNVEFLLTVTRWPLPELS